MAGSFDIDETIHQKTRLAIMSYLASVGESDFLTMRATLGLTDGNIAAHAEILQSKGLIEVEKGFAGKKTRTVYRITPIGRRAFADYVEQLGAIIRGASGKGN